MLWSDGGLIRLGCGQSVQHSGKAYAGASGKVGASGHQRAWQMGGTLQRGWEACCRGSLMASASFRENSSSGQAQILTCLASCVDVDKTPLSELRFFMSKREMTTVYMTQKLYQHYIR